MRQSKELLFLLCYYWLVAIVAQYCFNYQMIEGEPLTAY